MPTKREFQFEITHCFGGGTCVDRFEAIHPVNREHGKYVCNNCTVGLVLAEHKKKRLEENKKWLNKPK